MLLQLSRHFPPSLQDLLLPASLFIFLSTSLRAPQIRRLLTLCAFIYFIYVTTYTHVLQNSIALEMINDKCRRAKHRSKFKPATGIVHRHILKWYRHVIHGILPIKVVVRGLTEGNRYGRWRIVGEMTSGTGLEGISQV